VWNPDSNCGIICGGGSSASQQQLIAEAPKTCFIRMNDCFINGIFLQKGC